MEWKALCFAYSLLLEEFVILCVPKLQLLTGDSGLTKKHKYFWPICDESSKTLRFTHTLMSQLSTVANLGEDRIRGLMGHP
jgi:hypothetical protein